MSDKKIKIKRLLFAFCLPVFLMLAIYAFLGIYPFGGKSVLTIDLNNQYISFFSYLKEILKGRHGVFYSFSKTLGGDMVGLMAYYLMSPLNLLVLLFSVSTLPVAVELITLIKIGLCGVSFFWSASGEKAERHGLLFSTSYALMAYNIVYQQNIMWLDGVILLPAVALGIRRICQGKRPFLYLLALFFSIVFNYYIGFMICIFSVLYFLYCLFFCGERRRVWDFKVIGNYVAASALSGGLAMWLLFPVLKSLSGVKAGFDRSLLTLTANFRWRDFFWKLLPGSFDYEQIQTGFPNVFFGTVPLVFLVLFFISRKISARKKAGAALLLLIMMFSFYLQGLNLAWYGFNQPTWFPYRYSFIFSFLALSFAQEGFEAVRVTEFFSRKARPVWLPVILTAACSLELCVNGAVSLGTLNYADYGKYQEFVQSTEPAVNYVKQADAGFYRMEKTFYRKQCDPMLFAYNGLSHYSSTEKFSVKYFMGQTGFRNLGIWAHYNRGSVYAMDSLLGVKYILSKKPLEEPYRLLNQLGDVSVYQNPYALPIGFMADDDVLSCSIDNLHKFELQNEIWSALCPNLGTPVFVEEEGAQVSLKNLEVSDSDEYCYQKKKKGKKASIKYVFTAQSNDPVFAYFSANEMHPVKVTVNGKSMGKYFDTFQYDIIRLGTFQKGDEVSVKLTLEDETVNITNAWFYYQDMETFSRYYAELEPGAVKVDSFSDSKICGTVTNDGDQNYALFTIPFEGGWRAYVDGEAAETTVGLGIFLAVKIPAGTHRVELRYVPAGMKAGILLTGASVVLLAAWLLLKKFVIKD